MRYSASAGSSAGFGGKWSASVNASLSFAGSAVYYRESPQVTKLFTPGTTPGTYVAAYFVRDVLTQDLGTGVYTLTDPRGGRKFFDNTGKYTGFSDPGNAASGTLVYDPVSGRLSEITTTVGTSGTRTYAYGWDSGSGRITSVTYKIDGHPVLKTAYAYDGSGNLFTVKTYENSAGGTSEDWGTPITSARYSYHASGLLRHVITPPVYRQMGNNGINPESASEAQLNEFADTEYEYHADGRVKFLYTKGRRYVNEYSYASGSLAGDSYNTWRRKIEIKRPGDVVETLYINGVGQVILRRVQQMSGGTVEKTWYPLFQKFQTTGGARIILSASASAIDAASFSESKPSLVNLFTGEGRVEEYFYDANGLRSYVQLRKGTTGTAIRIRQWTYTSRTVAGMGTVRPLASEIVYPVEGSLSNPITTSYSYLWHTNSLQPSKVTKTLPAVPVSENGTGVSATNEQHFDTQGYLTKTVDGTGTATTFEYDKLRGGLTVKIIDQGTGKLNLRTDYQLDDRGRTIRELGPEHTIDLNGTATAIRSAGWIYYKDRAGERWDFRGYRKVSDSSDQAVGAITITKPNIAPPSGMSGFAGWRMSEVVNVDFTGTGIPSGSETFARSTWASWKLGFSDKSGELKEEWTYWTIPSSGYGTLDTDYGRKLFGYDAAGRQNETTCAGGTTDRTTYNAMGWPVAEQLGIDANPATYSVTKATGYDDNGNLAKETLFVDNVAANNRVTDYQYDWRNRQTGMERTVEKDGGGTWLLLTRATYDNRNFVTSVTDYHTSATGTNRTGYQTTAFDVLGRLYRMEKYAVSSTGAYSNPQRSDVFYDANGQVIKDAPAGSKLYTATDYDAVGRAVKIYRAYDTASSSSSPSSSSSGSSSSSQSSSSSSSAVPFAVLADLSVAIVMEQTENTFDAVSNLTAAITRQRYDDATGTGALQTPSLQPKARVGYVASYPDALGRVQATANYGTNDGGAWTRSATIPPRSGLAIQPEVVSLRYDSLGNIIRETDPAGIHTCRTWDKASRLITVVENCPESSSSSSSSSSSAPASVDVRTTRYQYTSDGWLKKLISENAETGQQVTEWVYGVNPSNGSALSSKRLVYQKLFPDAINPVTYAYNRQLQPTGQTDQLGTARGFSYDKLGRLLADTVTAFGTGVDNTVGKLENAYNERGLQARATSFNTAGTTKLNEIAWDYNGFNQPVAEYQEHAGGVNTSTSLKVGYGYADGSANTTRPAWIKYPHVGTAAAAVIDYTYSTQMADALSRIDEIRESGTTLSSWRYVGLGMVVAQKYNAAANTELTYGSSADAYSGYDRFGRIVATLWKSGANVLVESKYGRDAVGDIAWRKDVKAHAMSVATQDNYYWYDALRQVRQHERGELTPTGGPPFTGITPATRQQQELFAFDETGNWRNYHTQSPALTQGRSHNEANQITSVTGPTGVIQPAYDGAGNMTTMPAPADWTKAYTCKWDAWNRLVEIKDGSTVVGSFVYDARTRRIEKTNSTGTRAYYYNMQWRSIEERESGTTKAQQVFSPFDRWNLIRRKRTVSGTLDETRYVLRDYLDPVAIVTTAGAVDERYGYDAFGEAQIMDSSFGARLSSTVAWNWLFHGEFIDSETGLYNYGYRYYHPQLGRWISRDPIGEKGGINLYAFVINSAPNSYDILGAAPPKAVPVDMDSECLSKVKDMFNDKNSDVGKLAEKMRKRGCGLPVVTCECCEGSQKDSGGYFVVDRRFGGSRIQICTNNWDGNTSSLETILQHEMIHALQQCIGTDKTGCDRSICKEIEAYYNANCSHHTDEAARKQCTKGEYKKRGTGYSSSFYCSKEEYEESFERLYEECKSKNH